MDAVAHQTHSIDGCITRLSHFADVVQHHLPLRRLPRILYDIYMSIMRENDADSKLTLVGVMMSRARSSMSANAGGLLCLFSAEK